MGCTRDMRMVRIILMYLIKKVEIIDTGRSKKTITLHDSPAFAVARGLPARQTGPEATKPVT